jgi:hypothetical protein
VFPCCTPLGASFLHVIFHWSSKAVVPFSLTGMFSNSASNRMGRFSIHTSSAFFYFHIPKLLRSYHIRSLLESASITLRYLFIMSLYRHFTLQDLFLNVLMSTSYNIIISLIQPLFSPRRLAAPSPNPFALSCCPSDSGVLPRFLRFPLLPCPPGLPCSFRTRPSMPGIYSCVIVTRRPTRVRSALVSQCILRRVLMYLQFHSSQR